MLRTANSSPYKSDRTSKPSGKYGVLPPLPANFLVQFQFKLMFSSCAEVFPAKKRAAITINFFIIILHFLYIILLQKSCQNVNWLIMRKKTKKGVC